MTAPAHGLWKRRARPDRKCSECPVTFTPQTAKQKTCSSACGRERQRRRELELRARRARGPGKAA